MGNNTKIVARNFGSGIGAIVQWEIGRPLRDPDGQIVRDATGKAVLDGVRVRGSKHNTVQAAMLGYACRWLGYATTPKKINYVKFTHGSGSAYGATTYTNTTPDYGSIFLTSWEATAAVTMTTLSLVYRNTSDTTTPTIAYCTASINQVVAAGEVMNVFWIVTYVKHVDDQGTQNDVLARIRNYFNGVTTTTKPMDSADFTPDVGGGVNASLGTNQIDSGGSVTDNYIQWKTSATAPAGAATLSNWTAQDSAEVWLFIKTGLSVSWPAGDTLTATFKWTWSEAIGGNIPDSATVTDAVQVTDTGVPD